MNSELRDRLNQGSLMATYKAFRAAGHKIELEETGGGGGALVLPVKRGTFVVAVEDYHPTVTLMAVFYPGDSWERAGMGDDESVNVPGTTPQGVLNALLDYL